MAKGRRDYTWGFLNETGTGARYTESYLYVFAGPVGSLHQDYVYTYTVPAKYRLAINRIDVSTLSRVRNRIELMMDGIMIMGSIFDDNYCFTVSDQNPFYVEEGVVLQLMVYNADELSYVFAGQVIGVLEKIRE